MARAEFIKRRNERQRKVKRIIAEILALIVLTGIAIVIAKILSYYLAMKGF